MRSWPGLAPEDRAFYEELAGAGLPGGVDVAQWGTDEERRLDGAAQHTIHTLLRRAFQVTDAHGWAWQGLGLNLTWRTIGTRLSRNIAGADHDRGDHDALQHLMYTTAADWLGLAREHLFEDGGLDLDSVLVKSADAMSTRDVLASYVLATYLLEGRSELPEILRWVGRGTPSEDALTDALGMDLAELEWRVWRWVDTQERPASFDHTELVAAVERPLRRAARSQEPELLAVEANRAPPTPGPIALSSFQQQRVLARVGKLAPKKRAALLARCLEAARATGAPQVELVDGWLERAELVPDDVGGPAELAAHDPQEFRGGPARRVLEDSDRAVRERLPAAELPERAHSFDYRFATGRLVVGTRRTAVEELAELLEGRLPEHDLARALVLEALDRSARYRVEAEYFAHLYTDRDGNAYPDVTLFDVWSTGIEVEVPDVDVRAYAAKVWNDREIPIPLEQEDQELWYPRVAESARALCAHQRRLRCLADVWCEGSVELPRDHEAGIDVLHGAVVLGEEALRARLDHAEPDAAGFLGAIEADIDRAGNDAWNAAYERRDQLDQGVVRMRQTVLKVLLDERLIDV